MIWTLICLLLNLVVLGTLMLGATSVVLFLGGYQYRAYVARFDVNDRRFRIILEEDCRDGSGETGAVDADDDGAADVDGTCP